MVGEWEVGKNGHTEPLRTHEFPSFLIVRLMFFASEEATSGSVMRKADLILPSRRGSSHVRFCFSVPYLAITSILPVSGAAQLVAYYNHISAFTPATSILSIVIHLSWGMIYLRSSSTFPQQLSHEPVFQIRESSSLFKVGLGQEHIP